MKKLFVLGIAVAVAWTFLLPGTAAADVNDFVVKKFHADYVIDNSKVGGYLETTETITVDYSAQNHGIFRTFPDSYRGFSTKPNVQSVSRDTASESYTTYKENGNFVIKIGNPDATITGEHTYVIRYSQERIINFTADNQEFYWDVNGNGWQQPTEMVSATVTLRDNDLIGSQVACYVGSEGSSDTSCVRGIENKQAIFRTGKSLLPYEGLTIAVSMPENYFIQPTLTDKLRDIQIHIVGLLLAPIGVIAAYRLWRKYGKDYKDRGITVPEYEPPASLTPAEVGLLADYRVDNRDLAATLIDLAVRKVLRLHEEESGVLFLKSRKYKVELLEADLSQLKSFETTLLNGMFDELKPGSIVELSKLNRTKMATAVQTSRENIKKQLIDSYGYIEEKSNRLSGTVIAGAIIGGVAGFFAFIVSWGLAVSLIVSALAFLLAGIMMPRRSHAGVEAYEKIMGLKLYMNVAEKERLKMMQSVDRPFAGPGKTVELFEKLLPFAVALGVEKSWAKQFDGILKDNPDWLSSNSATAFSSAHIASSVASVASGFSSNFQTSSGSSGGGSSGGGGGGGGGGGW